MVGSEKIKIKIMIHVYWDLTTYQALSRPNVLETSSHPTFR